MKRPVAVTLSSVYYAGFSVVLISMLLWQIASGGIHERWTDAVFPVAFCFVLAVIPRGCRAWAMDPRRRSTHRQHRIRAVAPYRHHGLSLQGLRRAHCALRSDRSGLSVSRDHVSPRCEKSVPDTG